MRPTESPSDYDAVVLAGGRARRLGGLHKPSLVVGGRVVIHRIAEAVPDAARLVIVGPPRDLPPRAVGTREDPPESGPVPALTAGLAYVTAPWVAVLAADLPFLKGTDIAALRSRARGGGGAVLVDDAGCEQWLAGVWCTSSLAGALAGYRHTSLRGLFGPLGPRHVAPATAAGIPPPWLDCDTVADLEAVRTRTRGSG